MLKTYLLYSFHLELTMNEYIDRPNRQTDHRVTQKDKKENSSERGELRIIDRALNNSKNIEQ